MPDPLLTVQEAADRIGISKAHLSGAIKSGVVAHLRVGSKLRLRPESLPSYDEVVRAYCPMREATRPDPPSWIYFVQAPCGSVKIGVTKNIERRMRGIQSGHPQELRIIGQMPGDPDEEQSMHQRFAEHRIRPNSEWFHGAPEIICAARDAWHASYLQGYPIYGLNCRLLNLASGLVSTGPFSDAKDRTGPSEIGSSKPNFSPA